MKKKDWYKVEIRELIRKNLGKIHRKVGDSYGIDVSYLHKMISDYATQELSKAREEVVDDIWEEARSLASWDEHDGVIPIAQVENCLPEAMANIESKLTTK